MSGLGSPPWDRSFHDLTPNTTGGIRERDSAPDTARAQTPYPSDNAWTPHRAAHTQITHRQISRLDHTQLEFSALRPQPGRDSSAMLSAVFLAAAASVAGANPTVTFDTSMGSFSAELYLDRVPRTVRAYSLDTPGPTHSGLARLRE